MHKQRGFSLIELMTILGVAAVLFTIAGPALQQFTNNSRRTSAVNNFIASIHMARNTAITTNARVTMCATDAGATCALVGCNQGRIIFTDQNSN